MALFILQLVHTIVWVTSVAMVIGLAAYVLTGRFERFVPWALGFPVLIFIGILINGECILQTWARELSGIEEGWARDILFLPEPVARATMPVCVPAFAVIGSAAGWRWWKHRTNKP
ncbi:hypothetical protein [Glycocaulis sp.]